MHRTAFWVSPGAYLWTDELATTMFGRPDAPGVDFGVISARERERSLTPLTRATTLWSCHGELSGGVVTGSCHGELTRELSRELSRELRAAKKFPGLGVCESFLVLKKL